jgi:hypothetical protein
MSFLLRHAGHAGVFAEVLLRGASTEGTLLLDALEGRGVVALEVGAARVAGDAVAFEVLSLGGGGGVTHDGCSC